MDFEDFFRYDVIRSIESNLKRMVQTMTLGRKIQKMRKEKGWTQEELANRVGVSAQAVSKWETDVSSPDISLLRPLAEQFETNVDELLNMDEMAERPIVQLVPTEKRKSFDELVLRMNMKEKNGNSFKLNLPLPLVKMALEIGMAIPNINDKEIMKKLDWEKILALVESGVSGTLMEFNEIDGDCFEIVVE